MELQDGTEILARVVLSNADPRKTFLKLVGSDNLEPHFARRVRLLHADAGYMKLHCAASSLPDWTALPGVGPLPQHYAQARIAAVRTCWTAPGPPRERAAFLNNIRSRSSARRSMTPLRRRTASMPFRFGSNLRQSVPMARAGTDSATKPRRPSSTRSRNSPPNFGQDNRALLSSYAARYRGDGGHNRRQHAPPRHDAGSDAGPATAARVLGISNAGRGSVPMRIGRPSRRRGFRNASHNAAAAVIEDLE